MNKQHKASDETTLSLSRRDFAIKSVLAAVGVGVGGTSLMSAELAHAKESKSGIQYGNGPYPVDGMAAYSPKGKLRRMTFQRRALGPKDVAIKLHYCGVCHSDIHVVREDWGKIQYPLVPGHELAGEVVAVGSSASKYKVGSRVGAGCMVNSCRYCQECLAGLEQYCENDSTKTYGSKDRDGSITQGGYSTFVVVDEDFVISVPDSIDLAYAGPMMCAGITVYSPLRHWNIGPGKKIAVSGMGGLGHMGVKIATAMGAEVTVITTSPEKEQDAKRFGAKHVIHNKDGSDLSQYKRSFDFILDTVPYTHELDRITPLLKRDAVLCRVGIGRDSEPNEVGQSSLVGGRNAIAGSFFGGIRETQEMVDFCALHQIKPEITKIAMSGIDDAWEQVVSKKARYRFVIDMNA